MDNESGNGPQRPIRPEDAGVQPGAQNTPPDVTQSVAQNIPVEPTQPVTAVQQAQAAAQSAAPQVPAGATQPVAQPQVPAGYAQPQQPFATAVMPEPVNAGATPNDAQFNDYAGNPVDPNARPQTPGHAAPNTPKQHKKHPGARTFGLAFAGAAVACLVVLGANGTLAKTTATVIGGSNNGSITANADDNSQLAEQVSAKVLPSIVSIDVYTRSSGSSNILGMSDSNNSSQDGSASNSDSSSSSATAASATATQASATTTAGSGSSNSDSSLTESSLGSGVIISSDGYILTNYHVVEGADKLEVTANGKQYEATVTGTDATSDLAVLKIDASNLTAIEIGSSDNLKVGEWVMSAGSPFGLEQSVATGIVSAKSRTVVGGSSDEGSGSGSGNSGSSSASGSTVYTNMIQTDAAINPGNSGGALVDSNGKLVGINTLIATSSGSYSGVGFAIPVDYAINIAQQIIEGKTPTHAALGVTGVSVDSTMAQRYNLSADEGAYVNSVSSGSAAEKGGLERGDIITKFNGKDVSSFDDLMAGVRSCSPGDSVSVTVNRNGESKDLTVTLGSDSDSTSSSSSSK